MRDVLHRAAGLLLLLGGTAVFASTSPMPPFAHLDRKPFLTGFPSLRPFDELVVRGDNVTEWFGGPSLLTGDIVALEGLSIRFSGDGIPTRLERALHLVRGTCERLKTQGWTARLEVDEKATASCVLSRAVGGKGELPGLTVLAVETERGECEVTIANVAGSLDVPQIRRETSRFDMDLPWVDRLEK